MQVPLANPHTCQRDGKPLQHDAIAVKWSQRPWAACVVACMAREACVEVRQALGAKGEHGLGKVADVCKRCLAALTA